MTAKIALTLSGSRQVAYVPTRDEQDYPLGDEIVLRLLKIAVVDLFYEAQGGPPPGDPCPVCGRDDCQGPHERYTLGIPGRKE